MAIYKDTARNTWMVKMTYKDCWGKTHHTTKRGFKTKREATAWEANEKQAHMYSCTMTFESFVEVYFADKQNELKQRTIANKRYMIEKHILDKFRTCKMNEITPNMIIEWQKQILSEGFADTYVRMLMNQITSLFSHAVKIYGLQSNPCRSVPRIGKADAERLEFWTIDEYRKFIATFEKGGWHRVIFDVLYYTGMRIGECLALNRKDVLLDTNQISITKTYYRRKKEDIVTEPKTKNSIRVVDIPEFLVVELKEYFERLYDCNDDDRIFPYTAEAVQHVMKRHALKVGLEPIRVHALRHSHVAHLIDMGVEPLLIKNRLGHSDIRITLNTYGHLYPNAQKKLAEKLNEIVTE